MDIKKRKKISDGVRKKEDVLSDAPAFRANREVPVVRHAGAASHHETYDLADEKDEGIGTPSEDEDKIFAPEASQEHVLSRSMRALFAVKHSIRTNPPRSVRDQSRNARSTRWGGLAGAGVCVLSLILISTIWARITVTLKPRVDRVTVDNVLARFDTGISKLDSAAKRIPAERLTFVRTLRREFDASGRGQVEERARGSVSIYNQFSSAPQVLVKNTRFVTDTGIVYRIGQSVTIPGAKIEAGKVIPQSLEVELAADAAGEQANNSGEVKLRIPGFKGSPKYDGFWTVAPRGFSGGIKGEVSAASAGDIARAEEETTKELVALLEKEIAARVPTGLTFQTAFREIKITNVDAPKARAPGKRFAIVVSASGRVLAFREEDVASLIKELALKDDRTREFIHDSAQFEYQIRKIDFDAGQADVAIQGEIKTKAIIREAELAGPIAGKEQGLIAEFLSARSELASFTTTFFPPWRSSAPDDLARIRFVIQAP